MVKVWKRGACRQSDACAAPLALLALLPFYGSSSVPLLSAASLSLPFPPLNLETGINPTV